ncbi:MAG: hypothetical protein U5S82_17840 [Gammaproteobacteria bacterium]|nr:hypothetical protein [Gammaproteobacteria bacterium]
MMRALTSIVLFGSLLIATPAWSATFLLPTDGLDPAGQEIFQIEESIFITGQISPGSISVIPPIVIPATANVYVVPNDNWDFAKPIPADVTPGGALNLAGLAETLTGVFIDVELWPAPLTPGEYDIVIDDDLNGIFDGGVFDFVWGSGPAPGIVVVAPVPLPPALVMLAPALGLLLGARRRVMDPRSTRNPATRS